MPPYPLDLEQFRPQVCQHGFGFALWGFVFTTDQCRAIRCRQCFAVQFAVRRQRQAIKLHVGRRDHVLRQHTLQMATQTFDLQHRFRLLRRDIGHQAFFAGVVFPCQHHTFLDPWVSGQTGFDFAQLDTETPDLHLVVVTTQVFHRAVRQVASQVASAVHAPSVERIVEETLGAQLRTVQVTAGHLHTTDIQLTGHSQRYRLTVGIQQVDPRIGHRLADGRVVRRFVQRPGAIPGRNVDGCLGRTIEVEQANFRQLLFEAPYQMPRQGFTAAHYPQQATVTSLAMGQEQIEHRRHEVQGGDVLLTNHFAQVTRVTMTTRTRHYQPGAVEQRPEELPDRDVEAERGFLQYAVRGIQAVFVLHPQQAVDHATVFVHHAFRLAGRTGGVDHVSQMLGTHLDLLRVAIRLS
ncbi:hypothetical protein UCMB321_5576 [Pseudomonas batumici]|uniref:Uncharacterized protein n=1 Tax=Pseudomonas batumici TaxID=226910 RepID=A0A0C2I6E5_9PSED|nr:hypothetical protein UCMB321_5576 [Pseudomonas batumici]